MKKLLLLTLIVYSTDLLSQDNTPKFSNEFLAIGVGARSLGMANSVVSNTSDVTAGYWNPAALMEVNSKYQGTAMHAEYFAGIANYDYLSFTTQIDKDSRIAITGIRFAVDDIPDTRFLFDANGTLNYDNIQFFSAADYGFLLSYARRLPLFGGINVGGNIKIIRRIAGDFADSWGFGLDISAYKKIKNWQLGLVVRDVSTTFNAWSFSTEELIDVFSQTGNVIPENSTEITLPRALLGISRYFTISKIGILPAVEFDMTFDGERNTVFNGNTLSIDPHLGMELDYGRQFFLRFGVGQFQEVKDFDGSKSTTFLPSFGAGLQFSNVGIDYALTDIGDQSEGLFSHIFSLTVSFNDAQNE